MSKEECGCGQNNNFGIVSVVFGIISITALLLTLLAFLAPIFSIIIGLIGVVCGIIQLKKHKNNWAITGIVLSSLGILLAIVVIVKGMSIINSYKQLIATCQANPSLPQCAEIAKLLGAGA